uniref:NudC domain-containing protein 1 n=1 Tax=Cacopsylla melanoneura TaxID=428564 RepID=A0A8D8PTK3_9HEMI
MIVLDLKINPDLLNPNFNGYKLSLDPIGVCKINLPANVDQTFPSEDQYSFLYHKLFSLHNHLHQNSYSPDEYGRVYFVDEKWRVYENVVNPNNLTLESVREVCEIPANERRVPGHWNVCVKFVSETMCIISDGAGTLHVIDTHNVPWLVEYSSEVLGKGAIFSILDSVVCDTPDGKILHACLLSVEEVIPDQSTDSNPGLEPSKSRSSDQESSTGSSKLVNVVNWISLHKTENGWCLKRQRQIHVPGSIHYFALNKSGSAIYLIADQKFTFVSDSEKQIIPPADSNSADAKKPNYFWQQTDDDLKLWFPMSGEVSKGDVNISVTNSDLRITCRDKDLLRGNTVQLIDANLTTWNIETEKLEVVLQKQSPVRWTGVVVGDERGEEIIDPKLVEEVHQRLAHLCSESETVPDDSKEPGSLFNMQQLEECDSLASEYKALVRIDGEVHTGTHLMTLGGAQVLFSAPLSHGPGSTIPALCLRHDVDGALLQIEEDGESGAVSVVHEGTLQAFGYVQASKTGKKFSTCAPDMSYGLICESSRHVFIYVQQSRVSTELRNRVTGRRVPSVSKQHVVTLSNNEEVVLGVAPARGCLYVLTSMQLYMIKMES